MARLKGVQSAMASSPSSSLIDLENHLLRELDVMLDQEAELWALKSKINWMVLGDRPYFCACQKKEKSHFNN